jgi:hypothetical protein
MKRKCATCGKYSSKNYYTCFHNFIGYGFIEKKRYDIDV